MKRKLIVKRMCPAVTWRIIEKSGQNIGFNYWRLGFNTSTGEKPVQGPRLLRNRNWTTRNHEEYTYQKETKKKSTHRTRETAYQLGPDEKKITCGKLVIEACVVFRDEVIMVQRPKMATNETSREKSTSIILYRNYILSMIVKVTRGKKNQQM